MTFIKITSHEEDYEILRCDLLLFAIIVTHNDTTAMNYVLKDHIGSLYATITDGEEEYYSLSPLAFSQFFANMKAECMTHLLAECSLSDNRG